MRSMFSAVSGLKAHQLRMDTIGNNIANVNTVGFKGSRVTFQEVFSQTLRGGSAAQGGRGGTNPQQVGLGVDVASMDTFHIRGAVERTDYNTDLMINGEGFFIVSDDVNFLSRSYTRAGSFALDEDGNLVTPDGLKLLGYMYDPETGRMGTALEGIQMSKGITFPALSTGVALVDNEGDTLNPPIIPGDYPVGAYFSGNLNADIKTISPALAADDFDTDTGVGPLLDDLKGEDGKSPIVRDTTFSVYDELGGIHEIRLVFVKTKTNEVTVFGATVDGKLKLLQDDVANSHKITFIDGNINEGDKMGIKVGEGILDNGAKQFGFTVDFSKLTQFANESDASATNVRGYKQGSLNDFSIDVNGVITGSFTNGQERSVGQLALANFKNPAGLEKTGSNLYKVTPNSGEPMIGMAGTGGRGALNPGALEMSNVDLSREFTNMITTQRGFQASSRIITTSDEMLQELVNMKR